MSDLDRLYLTIDGWAMRVEESGADGLERDVADAVTDRIFVEHSWVGSPDCRHLIT